MTPEETDEVLRELWRYALAQTELITVLGGWIAELEARLDQAQSNSP
jgi:hypothetical protein